MSTAITYRTERFAHFGLGHQVEYDAARIGLVRNAFGRNLDRYRKTDAACGGSRFVFAGANVQVKDEIPKLCNSSAVSLSERMKRC